jgi:hypothetical protein
MNSSRAGLPGAPRERRASRFMPASSGRVNVPTRRQNPGAPKEAGTILAYGFRGMQLLARCARAEVSTTARFVLSVLQMHENAQHRCWPSQERMAAMMGCDRGTVARALLELLNAGLILRQKRPDRPNAYQYVLADTSGDGTPRFGKAFPEAFEEVSPEEAPPAPEVSPGCSPVQRSDAAPTSMNELLERNLKETPPPPAPPAPAPRVYKPRARQAAKSVRLRGPCRTPPPFTAEQLAEAFQRGAGERVALSPLVGRLRGAAQGALQDLVDARYTLEHVELAGAAMHVDGAHPFSSTAIGWGQLLRRGSLTDRIKLALQHRDRLQERARKEPQKQAANTHTAAPLSSEEGARLCREFLNNLHAGRVQPLGNPAR